MFKLSDLIGFDIDIDIVYKYFLAIAFYMLIYKKIYSM